MADLEFVQDSEIHAANVWERRKELAKFTDDGRFVMNAWVYYRFDNDYLSTYEMISEVEFFQRKLSGEL